MQYELAPSVFLKIILHMFVSLWTDWILWTFFILRKWKSSQNAFSSSYRRFVFFCFLIILCLWPVKYIGSILYKQTSMLICFVLFYCCVSFQKSNGSFDDFFLFSRLLPIKCFKLKIQQNDDCRIALQLIIAWAKDYSKVAIDGKG